MSGLKTDRTRTIGVIAFAFAAALGVQACHREGPAERAGEKIDNALDDHDLSAGPAQKAGRTLDEAAQDTRDAAKDAADKTKAAADDAAAKAKAATDGN